MTAPKSLAVVAAVMALSGCVAAPAPTTIPTPTPTPSYVPLPSGSASQSTIPAGALVPGTRLTVGPTPGTVLGEAGTPVRFVPADPALSFTCRPLTADERRQVANSMAGGAPDWNRPARAVDLPEEGFAVVAYWKRWDDGKREVFALVTGGGRFSDLPPGWRGSHTLAGVAFADGPKALQAARECVS